jgi:hypothetical protein
MCNDIQLPLVPCWCFASQKSRPSCNRCGQGFITDYFSSCRMTWCYSEIDEYMQGCLSVGRVCSRAINIAYVSLVCALRIWLLQCIQTVAVRLLVHSRTCASGRCLCRDLLQGGYAWRVGSPWFGLFMSHGVVAVPTLHTLRGMRWYTRHRRTSSYLELLAHGQHAHGHPPQALHLLCWHSHCCEEGGVCTCQPSVQFRLVGLPFGLVSHDDRASVGQHETSLQPRNIARTSKICIFLR